MTMTVFNGENVSQSYDGSPATRPYASPPDCIFYSVSNNFPRSQLAVSSILILPSLAAHPPQPTSVRLGRLATSQPSISRPSLHYPVIRQAASQNATSGAAASGSACSAFLRRLASSTGPSPPALSLRPPERPHNNQHTSTTRMQNRGLRIKHPAIPMVEA